MATPWVILCRIVRAEAEHSAAAAGSDFTLPVARPPPGVTFLAARRSAHPEPNRPDESPYIIATGGHCLLAHFGIASSTGKNYEDHPHDTHLVVVRGFHMAAGGLITASAERVPDPTDPYTGLSNVGSVGLISYVNGDYVIAELQVESTDDGARAMLFFFEGSRGEWSWWPYAECPLPAEELKARKWLPHGAVSTGSTLWWFDLRWGILSCDLDLSPDAEEEPVLVFHRLPGGHALDEAAPLMFHQRCITVSQGQLRYVEIIRPEVTDDDDDGSESTTVRMWTRIMVMGPGQGGWLWHPNYSMSFEELWKDASYRATELPRIVPSLAVVCPSDPNLVYFRVVRDEAYQLANEARTWPMAIGRFVLTWGDLPPAVAAGKTDVLAATPHLLVSSFVAAIQISC